MYTSRPLIGHLIAAADGVGQPNQRRGCQVAVVLDRADLAGGQANQVYTQGRLPRITGLPAG